MLSPIKTPVLGNESTIILFILLRVTTDNILINWFLGLSQEDVQEEFIKQLYNKEKQSLTSDQFLVALNEREALERERLSSMLQGLSMYSTMTAGEREITLGQLLLMKIRAVHERQFHSGTITVGLVERMLGHHDRLVNCSSRILNIQATLRGVDILRTTVLILCYSVQMLSFYLKIWIQVDKPFYI